MSQWKRVFVATGDAGQTLKPHDFNLGQTTTDWAGFDPAVVPADPTDWFAASDTISTFVSTKTAALAGKNTLKILKHSTDGGDTDNLVPRFWQDQQWSDDGYGTQFTPNWPGITAEGWYGESDNVTGTVNSGIGKDIHANYSQITPIGDTSDWDDGAGAPTASSTSVYSGALGSIMGQNGYASGCWEATANGGCLASGSDDPAGLPSDADATVISGYFLNFSPDSDTHGVDTVYNGLISDISASNSSRTLNLYEMKVSNTGSNLEWTDGNAVGNGYDPTVTRTDEEVFTGNNCSGNGNSGQGYAPLVDPASGIETPGGGDQVCYDSKVANHYIHPLVNAGVAFGTESLTFGEGAGGAGVATTVLNAVNLGSNVNAKGHTIAALAESAAGRDLAITDLMTGYASYANSFGGGHCKSAGSSTVDATAASQTARGCCETHGNGWDEQNVVCLNDNSTGDDFVWTAMAVWNPSATCTNSTNPLANGTLACDNYSQWISTFTNVDINGGETTLGTHLVHNDNDPRVDFSSVDHVNTLNFKSYDTVAGDLDPMNGDLNITVNTSTGGNFEFTIDAPGPSAGCPGTEGGAGTDSESCDGFGSGGVLRYIETGNGFMNTYIGDKWDAGVQQSNNYPYGTLLLGSPSLLTSGTTNSVGTQTHYHEVDSAADFTGAQYIAGTGTPKLLRSYTAAQNATLQGGFKIRNMEVENQLISDTSGGGIVDVLSGNTAIFDSHIQLNVVQNVDGETVGYSEQVASFEMGVGSANSGAGDTRRESGLIREKDGVYNSFLETGNFLTDKSFLRFSDFGGWAGDSEVSYSAPFGGCTGSSGWGTSSANNASYPGRCDESTTGVSTPGIESWYIQGYNKTSRATNSAQSWFDTGSDAGDLGSIYIQTHESFDDANVKNSRTEGHLAIENGFVKSANATQTVHHFKIGKVSGDNNYYKGNAYSVLPTTALVDGMFLFNDGSTSSGAEVKGMYIYKVTGNNDGGDAG